jgi:hypothetical protein
VWVLITDVCKQQRRVAAAVVLCSVLHGVALAESAGWRTVLQFCQVALLKFFMNCSIGQQCRP